MKNMKGETPAEFKDNCILSQALLYLFWNKNKLYFTHLANLNRHIVWITPNPKSDQPISTEFNPGGILVLMSANVETWSNMVSFFAQHAERTLLWKG